MNVWLTEIWRAWRASVRRPGFLLLAAGVLALGIGASVAVFTLIDQVLMQPLPLPQAARVMMVGPLEDGQVQAVSPLQYQHAATVPGLASSGLVYSLRKVNIAGGRQPQVVEATYITHGVLPSLGLHPLLGRNFTAGETQPHAAHVALLSYGLWQRRYGGRRDVLGRTLDVKGTAYTVIGVLPTAFGKLGFGRGVVLPFGLPAQTRDDNQNFQAVARLATGADAQAVSAQIDARLRAMYAAMPASRDRAFWLHRHFGVEPITAAQHADAHGTLVLFMACALFVLLVALVNLVNLMLLRSLARQHDLAVRGALGASTWRLALPALAEGLLVGVLSGLVGALLATLGLAALQGTLSADWWPATGVHVPWDIGWLAIGVGAVVAVSAAALGVWRSRRVDRVDALREGGRSGLGHRGGLLARLLVVTQMVLATVLLCGSGLLLHGLYRAAHTPLGFASAHRLAFDLQPIATRYPDVASVDALSRQLVRRLEAIPGVTQAVATTNLPTGGFMEQFRLNVQKPSGQSYLTQYRGIGPGFFHLFDIRLIKGRAFTRHDVRGGQPVAIISQSLAARMFGGHALGQTIERGSGAQHWSVRIVGVVDNTLQFGALRPMTGMLYVPLAQMPTQAWAIFRHFFPLRFVLHGHGDPMSWRTAVRKAVAQVAPGQPVSNFRSMDQVVATTTADTRQTLWLIGIFAALALLLAGAGMYAVMAVAVAAREREFGVRMALGAKPSRLVRLVLRGGLVQIVIGLVIGVGIVLGVSGLLKRLLFELLGRANAVDPVALVSACMVLVVAGLLACLLPAWRAGRVAPMHALRGE
ncbi:MAG TPA: ADOP family duplicated permease [Rhodanobacteraceae bacterium]